MEPSQKEHGGTVTDLRLIIGAFSLQRANGPPQKLPKPSPPVKECVTALWHPCGVVGARTIDTALALLSAVSRKPLHHLFSSDEQGHPPARDAAVTSTGDGAESDPSYSRGFC